MSESPARREYRLPSDLAEVQKASAEVLRFVEPLKLPEGLLFDVRLCLEEALINAMKYGCGLDRAKKVRLEVEYDANRIKLTVEDPGQGFDPGQLKDCTQQENLLRNRGRGVYLIHQLMDEVRYNAKGNCLTMIKDLKKAAERGGTAKG